MMIAYMPFTYLSQNNAYCLTGALGPLSVYVPSDKCIPSHMREYADRGLLDLRIPDALDLNQVDLALDQFKQWAAMHDGSIGDMAGYLKSSAGRPPLVDEFSTTQIHDQIRNYGKDRHGEGSAGLYQAALFLAMAMEYDRHQDDMVKDLTVVEALERQMRSRLSGGGAESGQEVTDAGPAGAARASRADLLMTEARIRSWAELAAADRSEPIFLLTTSHAVLDYLVESVFDARPMGAWDISPPESADDTVKRRREAIAAIASQGAAQIDALAACAAPARGHCRLQLDLTALNGMTARSLLARLLADGADAKTHSSRGPDATTTLVGVVTTPANNK